MKIVRVHLPKLTLLAVLMLLGGCGQKGPLQLPEAPPANQPAPDKPA